MGPCGRPNAVHPSTWVLVATDGDKAGKTHPQNVYDAAATAGTYLCYGGRDLSTPDGLKRGILSYNASQAYLETVLRWKAYFDLRDTIHLGDHVRLALTLAELVNVADRCHFVTLAQRDHHAHPTATTPPTSTSPIASPTTVTPGTTTSPTPETPAPADRSPRQRNPRAVDRRPATPPPRPRTRPQSPNRPVVPDSRRRTAGRRVTPCRWTTRSTAARCRTGCASW